MENNNNILRPSVYNPDYLLHQARWIRDDLDLQVARDGPDALHSNDILSLDEFLRRLLASNLGLDDIRTSRIHLAIVAISGKATRWPVRLIDRAEALQSYWEKQYGSLKKMKPPLYEPGGRLHGISRAEDVTTEKLLVEWLKAPGVKVSPLVARRRGDLGFKPGDWWISPVFALQAGIIDATEPTQGTTFDAHCAYAVLMTNDEETNSSSPEAFTYRCRPDDKGRYRLAAASTPSRLPVRILRGHSLRSFWSPKAGIRYDGLHRIVGWSIHRDVKSKEMVYDVRFERLGAQVGMDAVLRRPFADEVEDYKEYKRLRQIHRTQQLESEDACVEPTSLRATDGTLDGAHLEEAHLDELSDEMFHKEMMRQRLSFERIDSMVE